MNGSLGLMGGMGILAEFRIFMEQKGLKAPRLVEFAEADKEEEGIEQEAIGTRKQFAMTLLGYR